MPYHVKGKCVYKDDGSKVKCHENHKKAVKHAQALNINVTKPELKKKVKKKKASYDDVKFDFSDLMLVGENGPETFQAVINSDKLSRTIYKTLSETASTSSTSLGHIHAAAPVLVTIPNVPILEAGVEYELQSGPATFTPEDIRDAITAANEDPSIPLPRLKLGHIDPRYNKPQYDGDPAFGKATNLRLSENGMVVYADYVGVPKWLADIMPTAYPSRSIEGYRNVESQGGKRWRLVLSAVASLGIKWPGITQLEDLKMYYGTEVPDGVEIDAELIAAATKEEEGDAMTVVNAAANLDDIRRAFYSEYVNDPNNSGARWWWVRAVMTDPNQLVVEDEESGQLYLLPFSSDDKGTVSFGEADPVRIDYVPDEQQKEAAQFIAAALTLGHELLASWSSREESRLETEAVVIDLDGMVPDETRRHHGSQ
jgi:hypothetical protein